MVHNLKHAAIQTEEQAARSKSIFIDFDLYTDGDEEFKQELISLIIDNIKELLWALDKGVPIFKKVAHKIKSTVAIINDADLDCLIIVLSDESIDQTEKLSKANMLTIQCDNIIKYLEDKIQ